MLYVVKKKGKYLKGHSYSTLMGYKFSWTSDLSKARQMEIRTALHMAVATEGGVKATTHEL